MTDADAMQVVNSISPDGQLLVLTERHPKTGRDLWVVELDAAEHPARPYLETPFSEGAAKISPTGHHVVYVSDESGRPEIYVRDFPEPGMRWQISTEGGTEPVWPRDGHEIFYRAWNGMMAVPVSEDPVFKAETPTKLFEDRFATGTLLPRYDVTRDGERFLMITDDERGSARELHLVSNWFEELKRLVPMNK